MTQFVWLYKHDERHADDLRLSMLSVHRYFQGEASYVIVGDRPEWLDGHIIHVPAPETRWQDVRSIATTKQRVRYVDTMKKMELWCKESYAHAQFVWMMDDQCFIRPFTVDFFRTRLWQDPITKAIKPWEKLVTQTMRRFIGAKHYSTHFPQMFERQKMLDLYEYLNMPKALYLFDCGYGNFWGGQDAYYGGIARRITKSHPRESQDLAFFESLNETVINWDDRAYDYPGFKQFLKDRICSGQSQCEPLPFASSMQISSL